MTRLEPGAVIGMLGGGQLGRMTAIAAAQLGYRTHVYSPGPGPASQVTSEATFAPYDDEDALAAFAEAVDVVTYEFENVPARTAAFLAERVPVRPGPRALEVCQHRVREKSFLNDAGAPTVPWAPCNSAADLAGHAEVLGRPCVLKTARGGYDGKGQAILREGDDPAEVWASVVGDRERVACIVEGFVDFAYEASVVVARNPQGDIVPYDLVENRHRDHVLHQTIAPAPANRKVLAEADELARLIIDALDYVGVLGIELFVTRQGEVLVNEMAPRPHNSGHWTLDGALTSQFEQHARSVLGLPLGSPKRLGRVVMTNLLGDDVEQVPKLMRDPTVKVHLYGKGEARPGRKMGHWTMVLPG